MPRWRRLVAAGYPLHITQRGHNKDATFLDERDLGVFRQMLGLALIQHRCSLHAYALMTNHFHLLLTPSEPALPSKFMQSLTGRFVRYWNRRHSRSGTLWGGRFYSAIVDTDRYVLASTRYIDLNPVRAGIVADPGCYAWSSYRALALGDADPLLTPHAAIAALGNSAAQSRQAYRALCLAAIPDSELQEIRSATRGGGAIATDATRERLEQWFEHPLARPQRGGDRRSEHFRQSHCSG